MATLSEQGEALNPEKGALYYTVAKETLEPIRATIKGEVPSWINGCLFRNGPGKFELGDQQMNHIFDALSILHRFDIHDGEISPIRYESDAFFFFHFINSYEDDGHVVVDLIGYQDTDILDKAYVKLFRRGVLPAANAECRRYVLPLDTQEKEAGQNLNGLSYSNSKSILQSDGSIHCIPDLICDQGIETPQINYRLYNGKPYRYFYGVAVNDTETLIKSDAMMKSSLMWHEDSCFPSEPYFVSRPDATAEDDGVILSAVTVDVKKGRDPFLLILDARNFQEIGRAVLQAEVPIGFHGIFVQRN